MFIAVYYCSTMRFPKFCEVILTFIFCDAAQKYKRYNKLRDLLTGKSQPAPKAEATHGYHHQQSHSEQRKRRSSDAAMPPPETPSKRSKLIQTPRKVQQYSTSAPNISTGSETPSAATMNQEPAPVLPSYISPTPQKDGRVLGLFDLLGRTPSASVVKSSGDAPSMAAATPSKHRDATPLQVPLNTDGMTPTTARFAHTPRSAVKHHASDAGIPTPLRERNDRGNSNNQLLFKTPSTNRVSKDTASTPKSATPSFLRRRNAPDYKGALLGTMDEDEENEESGVNGVAGTGGWKKRLSALRLPRKLVPVGKGLSSVVAGLRKMEDEMFAEEEAAAREMEREEAEKRKQAQAQQAEDQAQSQPQQTAVAPSAEVPDSQTIEKLLEEEKPAGGRLLSGFDDEAALDSPDELGDDQSQQTRVWKKKGQKRQTRLVRMRPTRVRRPTAQTVIPPGEEDDDEDDDELVPETQAQASGGNPEVEDGLRSDEEGSDEAFEESESENDEEEEDGKKKKKGKKAAAGDTTTGKDEDIVKKAVRKVKATAHANFRRLKLRNSGAKGGPAYNSRWRRRR